MDGPLSNTESGTASSEKREISELFNRYRSRLRLIVEGNHIGTDASGKVDLGNNGAGVFLGVSASSSRVGGTTPAARNVISGNNSGGVGVGDSGKFNQVQGNFIGTDIAGTQALGKRAAAGDILIGGVGRDKLFGHEDDDLLIAGTTSHDQNALALMIILAEWTSSRGYASRVMTIKGGSGPVLDDTDIFLKPGESVQDDGARDELFGSSGQDWFFASLVHDKLSRIRGEQVQ